MDGAAMSNGVNTNPCCAGSGENCMAEEFPLVSIVITAYNQARYLDEAIQSVLNQNYSPVELIVLDDGSTDDTRAVLEGYTGRICWESHANMGQAATLNKGWEMSKGEILSYLSSDDYLLPDAVSTAVRFLRENPETVQVYCDFQLVDEQSQLIREKIAPDYCYERMVVDSVCMPGPGVFFRRQAYAAVGGWDPSFRQMPDYEFWIRLGICGPFHKIPKTLAAYRIHDESQSIAASAPGKADEPVRALEKYYNRPDVPDSLLKQKCKAKGNAALISARLHIRSGRYATGITRLKQAIGECPALACTPRCIRIILNAARHGIMRRLTGGTVS